MALLSKHEPRRFRRPADGEEDVQVALVRNVPRHARHVSRRQNRDLSQPDPSRPALLDVIALRGNRPSRGSVAWFPPFGSSVPLGTTSSDITTTSAYNSHAGAKRSAYSTQRHDPSVSPRGVHRPRKVLIKNHPESYRFLSYAKWYMLCECNRLLTKRSASSSCRKPSRMLDIISSPPPPDDVSDEEAADPRMSVEDARREASLGARASEDRRACGSVRRSFADARRARRARAAGVSRECRAADALTPRSALGAHSARVRRREDEGAPEPATEQSESLDISRFGDSRGA